MLNSLIRQTNKEQIKSAFFFIFSFASLTQNHGKFFSKLISKGAVCFFRLLSENISYWLFSNGDRTVNKIKAIFTGGLRFPLLRYPKEKDIRHRKASRTGLTLVVDNKANLTQSLLAREILSPLNVHS